MPLASGEKFDLPACGLPASFSVQQCRYSSGVCPQSRGINVAAVEEMMCVVYVRVTEGE